MAQETPIVITGAHLQGSASELEARVQHDQHTQGVIVCHPHPLFDGSMDNKVVSTVIRAAKQQGLGTLRFNFRGVGQSGGEHDHGQGEQDDVASALHYAHNKLGWQRILLAGFSFGAGMACLSAQTHSDHIAGLFLIAPAVHHFDAPNTLANSFDTFVYMGDADEVVPFEEVEHWVSMVTPAPHWTVFEDTSHFFHGKLVELKSSLEKDFTDALTDILDAAN